MADGHFVLNAFRHHRGGRTFMVRGVLAADKCSTPFGITEVGALRRVLRFLWPVHVLNAFRHHRGGRWFLQPPCHRSYLVLNAFRHHRGGRMRM